MVESVDSVSPRTKKSELITSWKQRQVTEMWYGREEKREKCLQGQIQQWETVCAVI